MTAIETVTFCPHGISHQPGQPNEQGRSQWCGECFSTCSECGELIYLDTDAPALPLPWRNFTDGELHTCHD